MNGRKSRRKKNGIRTSMNSIFLNQRRKRVQAAIPPRKPARVMKMIWDWTRILKTWTFSVRAGSTKRKMTFKVNRNFISFPITDFQRTKQQMLNWASRFNICCFLDNHSYDLPGHTVECLLAAGAKDAIQADAGNALDTLRRFTKAYSG